ncbi:uncharacterized protein LOC117176297 [Belonocnema kinseyi]|uniref:uncharacterized protein LOC117176297 n=1 Tax=Belonocnema kinseyi TaxID=2817044 RepID=UPI00143DFC37|nr:uncharacterized protein LOC117176297 [Belonocnema kinseyi]
MSDSDNLGSAKNQRRFVAAWLNDFPCIEELPNDNTKFLCTICKQKYKVVNKQRLRAHVESKRHQKMQNNEFKRSEKEDAIHKFLPKWLEDIRFKSWLQMVPKDENKFHCTLCNVDRMCTGGVGNLIRHADAPEHVKNSIESGIETLQDIPAEDIHDSIQSFEDRKKTREIQFANLGRAANIPYSTMTKILTFFQETDPTILQHMTAGATKISNIVRNVLGPV